MPFGASRHLLLFPPSRQLVDVRPLSANNGYPNFYVLLHSGCVAPTLMQPTPGVPRVSRIILAREVVRYREMNFATVAPL